MPVILAGVAALGLAIGSFLNVALYRLPRHESIVFPGSHCPTCAHAVRARHNIPVVGWLLLGGKCADCAEPISIRYPVVEILTGAVVLATCMRVLHVGVGTALPAYLCFATALVVALALRLHDHVTTFTAATAPASREK